MRNTKEIVKKKKKGREEEEKQKGRTEEEKKGITLCDGSSVASPRPLVGLGWFHGFPRQKFNLPYQKALFVCKLVVVGAILQKFGQEFEQPISVIDENALHGH